MEHIDLQKLPDIASKEAYGLHLGNFKEKHPALTPYLKEKGVAEVSRVIFGNSPYLSDLICRYPEFYLRLFDVGFEECLEEIVDRLRELQPKSKDELMQILRVEKQKASLLIAITEITGIWPIAFTTEQLSLFADMCIFKSCEFLLRDYHEKQFIKLKDVDNPVIASGLVIIALGKLGSFELNYSSDIDLAIYYEDDKLEYLGRKTLAQFYIELAQELVKILHERTRDGYVFRVDMRLRPDPAANPLAVSLKKAEKYYFTVGQNWERAAFIKNRFICGDKRSGATFNEFMKRNVWRKSLDFETVEDIHSIKRQIDTKQGVHPDSLYGYNVKLGRGGIREIEFFAQTQQLIWGGRKHDLRERRTIDALYALVREDEVKQEVADDLVEAYTFFRMVEHRLQMVNDEQTHTLPKDKEGMESIAIFCGYKNSKEFLNALHERISKVQSHYARLFENSASLASDLPQAQGSLIFTGTENHPDTLETLEKIGFAEPERVSDIVRGWHHGRIPVTTKKRARAELTKLMPFLFGAFSKASSPAESFIRFDEFLSKLPDNSQIFALLLQNPNVLTLLAEVFGGYPEVADTLNRNPALLEYVVTAEFYNKLPEIERLQTNIDKELKHSGGSVEASIEAIKSWTNDRKFRIGIQLVRDRIKAEQVFLGLSSIAEVVLRTTVKVVTEDFEKEFGKPEGGKLAVMALGKFGSRELTFKSDLDVVFIYDFKKETAKLSASSYYIKLAGRIISAMSSITEGGRMYEVDARLRPLGEKGPLAVSVKSFDEYYNPDKEGSAWIYEYMALTRARVIAQDKKFEKKLQDMVKQKLQYKWKSATLHKEAGYILKKYHETKKQTNALDIKHPKGGLFDLEFMVRFLQLKNLHAKPELYGQSTRGAIEALHKEKVISKKDHGTISSAFILFKEAQNLIRITSEEEITPYMEKLLCEVLGFKKPSELYATLEKTKSGILGLIEKYLEN